MEWILNLFRWISCFLAWLVYRIVELCYVLFGAMCNLNLKTLNEGFDPIVKRFQVFLGLIMLFVVAFELLRGIADPSSSKSINSKLLKKVAISVVALVAVISTPGVFDILSDLQNDILEEQVVEKAILGGSDSNISDPRTRYIATGKYFAYKLFFAFYSSENQAVEEKIMSGEENLWYAVEMVNEEDVTYNGHFISWLSGILLGSMLITFAIDVGVRSFTLMLLQVLAPIPILLYITPKGEETFQSYYKTYLSVYAELFIKIALCYISLFMLHLVTELLFDGKISDIKGTLFPGFEGMGGLFKALLYVLLLVAIFIFGKKLPELLKSVLPKGIGDGLFKNSAFNPFNVLKGAVGLTGRTLSATASAGASIAGSLFESRNEGLSIRDRLNTAFEAAGNSFKNRLDVGNAGRRLIDKFENTPVGKLITDEVGNLIDSADYGARATVAALENSMENTQSEIENIESSLDAANAELENVQQVGKAVDGVKESIENYALNNGIHGGKSYENKEAAISDDETVKVTSERLAEAEEKLKVKEANVDAAKTELDAATAEKSKLDVATKTLADSKAHQLKLKADLEKQQAKQDMYEREVQNAQQELEDVVNLGGSAEEKDLALSNLINKQEGLRAIQQTTAKMVHECESFDNVVAAQQASYDGAYGGGKAETIVKRQSIAEAGYRAAVDGKEIAEKDVKRASEAHERAVVTVTEQIDKECSFASSDKTIIKNAMKTDSKVIDAIATLKNQAGEESEVVRLVESGYITDAVEAVEQQEVTVKTEVQEKQEELKHLREEYANKVENIRAHYQKQLETLRKVQERLVSDGKSSGTMDSKAVLAEMAELEKKINDLNNDHSNE